MRNDRLLRGFEADALKALWMSSVEKESFRGSCVPDVGIGMMSVIVGRASEFGLHGEVVLCGWKWPSRVWETVCGGDVGLTSVLEEWVWSWLI